MSSGSGMKYVGADSQITAERERMQKQDAVDPWSNPAVAAEADKNSQQDRQRKQQPVETDTLAEWLLEPEPRPSGVCLVIA